MPTTTEPRRNIWPVMLTSVVAGIVASAATELYGLGADAAGIPMEAGSIGAASASPISVGMFAMGTMIAVFWGTILAVLVARFARRPVRVYAVTTVLLAVVSLAGPLGAPHTAASTKVMLAIAHVIAAAIVIPWVAHRLSKLPPRR